MTNQEDLLKIIIGLANDKESFTTDDIRPLLLPGMTSSQIPSAVGKARRDGLIEEIDRVKSIIPERKGSLVPVLRARSTAPFLRSSLGPSGAPTSAALSAGTKISEEVAKMQKYLQSHGYVTGVTEVAIVLLLLVSRNWLVLSGPSGTGKSSLVTHLSSALDGVMHDVQIKPNWVSSEDSLGYFSETSQTFVPGLVYKAILAAAADPSRLHFLRLDEMNLASPEYYLAEVLSASESWETTTEGKVSAPIQLPPTPETLSPQVARIPDNLFLIGTVNVDETTRPLSPKVLDRTAIFNIPNVDLYGSVSELSAQLPLPDIPLISKMLRSRSRTWFDLNPSNEDLELVARTLTELNAFATTLGGPIAYRQRDGVLALIANARSSGLDLIFSDDELIDIGLSSFVLPKWHGSTDAAVKALEGACRWALTPDSSDEPLPATGLEALAAASRFPISSVKLIEMRTQTKEFGYFSAWQ